MFRNYLKATLRNLWKHKGYCFLNVFGLAIGIACAGLIFLWAEDEITFDHVNLKKDRLYSVQVDMSFNGNMSTMGSTPRPMRASLLKDVPGIVNAARISDQDQRMLFGFAHKSVYAIGRYADPSLFSMFTLPFTQGNPKSAFEQLYSIVITEKAAKKFFGEEKNVVGKKMRIDNKQDFVITGVLKDPPENSSLQFEWLAPYQIVIEQDRVKDGVKSDQFNWGSYGPFTYVELDRNADPAGINRQLKDYIHHKDPKEKNTALLFPMSSWRLYGDFANGKPTGGGRVKQVRMLSAIAWIILFIACINFMNLATASSQQRAKEVGVRKVLGAGKKGLVIQFLSEAMLMSLLATAGSMVIMLLALPSFNMLMQKHLSLGLGSLFHIVVLLIICIICGLVAGSYPSLYLSSFNPSLVLKGSKIKTSGAAMIRKGLVVIQFTVSIVFIISTIIVYMQIQYVKNRDLGFNKDNLIEINPQCDISNIFSFIKTDLLKTGLIANAAVADHPTLYGGDTDNGFKWQGKTVDNQISIAHRNVSPEFVATSGMKIIEGSDFRNDRQTDNSNVIVNESMAKLMGKKRVIGEIIQSSRSNADDSFTNMTVIGLVKDYVYGNIYVAQAAPLIIFCKPPEYQDFIYVRAKENSDMEQVLLRIEEVMKKNNPSYPFEYQFVDDQFNKMYQNEALVSKASSTFGILAIIISCLGLFGLAAFTAEQRTKEIGVRKVLGASVAGIAGLLSKDFLQLVIISCFIAFPLGWWTMHDWLQGYEYRIMISWWVFPGAGILAMMIALITVSFHAINAALSNPVKTLRSE
jgi:putative ABC transport system permease protein